MSFYALARELRNEVKDWVRDYVSTFIKLLPYSVSTASGEGDKLQGYQTEGSDEEKYDYDGRRIFPFGIRSRPPKGVFGVWIGSRSRSGNGVIVGAESSRFGPSDLADGEVAIYNKATGCVIKMDENGKITIDATSGQDIVLNGGTLKVARQTDKTIADTTMATWISAVSTFINGLVPASVVPPTDFGVINGGANNVKG